MSGEKVRSNTCGDWERGSDCAFNEFMCYGFAAFLWLLTFLLLVNKGVFTRGTAPTGAAKWCLLSTAMSSLCMSADAVVYLVTGPHIGENNRHNPFFIAIGTLFLGYGMRRFALLWCAISDALGSQTSILDASQILGERLVGIVWLSYNIGVFLSIAVALVLTWSGTSSVPGFYSATEVLLSCILFLACFAFTAATVMMWIVVAMCLPKDANVGSLIVVTKINLIQQSIYNITLLLAGAIYVSPASYKYGMNQAVVFVLRVVAAWLMHIQILIFFTVTPKDDPFFSDEQFQSLLLLTSDELKVVADAEAGAVVNSAAISEDISSQCRRINKQRPTTISIPKTLATADAVVNCALEILSPRGQGRHRSPRKTSIPKTLATADAAVNCAPISVDISSPSGHIEKQMSTITSMLKTHATADAVGNCASVSVDVSSLVTPPRPTKTCLKPGKAMAAATDDCDYTIEVEEDGTLPATGWLSYDSDIAIRDPPPSNAHRHRAFE